MGELVTPVGRACCLPAFGDDECRLANVITPTVGEVACVDKFELDEMTGEGGERGEESDFMSHNGLDGTFAFRATAREGVSLNRDGDEIDAIGV